MPLIFWIPLGLIMMLGRWLSPHQPKQLEKKLDHIFSMLSERYPYGDDPWGLSLGTIRRTLERGWFLYEKYFRVRVHGKKNVQDRPLMVVANHTGQIPLDGALIGAAFLVEIDPPRILRAMVERFVLQVPFLNPWSAQCGGVLGDRQNCLRVLARGESILVFPEGVRGISKNTRDYYRMAHFSRGFFRMALTAGNVEILPVAVIGAEEMFPYVLQLEKLAKMLGLPALPLSINLLPLPSPIDIYIGSAYPLPKNLSPNAPDDQIDFHVNQIQKQIERMIGIGLNQRRALPFPLPKWK